MSTGQRINPTLTRAAVEKILVATHDRELLCKAAHQCALDILFPTPTPVLNELVLPDGFVATCSNGVFKISKPITIGKWEEISIACMVCSWCNNDDTWIDKLRALRDNPTRPGAVEGATLRGYEARNQSGNVVFSWTTNGTLAEKLKCALSYKDMNPHLRLYEVWQGAEVTL